MKAIVAIAALILLLCSGCASYNYAVNSAMPSARLLHLLTAPGRP